MLLTPRENFLRALRRDGPEWVPFDLGLCPALREELRRRTGHDDPYAYFGIPLAGISPAPSVEKADFSVYYPGGLPEGAWLDEWGIGHRPGGFEHFEKMLHPMAGFTTPEEIAAYPLPDLDAGYRWAGAAARAAAIKARDLVAVGHMHCTLFETAWYLRGMEAFLADLLIAPAMAGALLDRLADLRAAQAAHYARAGADLIQFGDDVSTQLAMMLSPALWRREIKPRLARVIAAARAANPETIMWYHGDGNLSAIVPDLIEIGIQVLNPVQPECIDPADLKAAYGDRLSFWGAVGTQTIMPFGTPDEVKAYCKTLIETVGRGGGLIVAPTHVLEPEVPWENVEAMVAAVREYGRYR